MAAMMSQLLVVLYTGKSWGRAVTMGGGAGLGQQLELARPAGQGVETQTRTFYRSFIKTRTLKKNK